MLSTDFDDVYGKAILDHYKGIALRLSTFSSIAGEDELPLHHLFRNFNEMPAMEQMALQLSEGKVLDLGCGAGSHSLFLQEKNLDITAIDISKGAIEACKLRGVKNAFHQDFWQLKDQKYDTIIALMNGTGICGSLANLSSFLIHLKSLLNSGGQVLIDSSDLIYMFEDEDGTLDLPSQEKYYGEVEFYFEYNNQRSSKFEWLYIDYYNLEIYANEAGFKSEMILEGTHYDYLARLSLE
jgi:SAM-dependent methyltransferase